MSDFKSKLDIQSLHRDNQSSTLFDNENKWLTSKEAARYLSISPQNLRQKIQRGQIKPQGKVGRTYRFKREGLDELLERNLKGGRFQ